MLTTFVISVFIAVVVSFLCSLTEAIFFSMNPLTLNKLKRKRPKVAESWIRLKKTVARPIAAILILNTIAHTGGATVAGAAFTELYGQKVLWVFSAVFTLIILLGTEILPKIIGVTFRDKLAPHLAMPLEVITKFLGPLIHLVDKMFAGLKRDKEQEQITTADIVTLASMARAGKAIEFEQENIIVNAIRLDHTTIEPVMIPSDKVKFIRKSDTIEDIVRLTKEFKHTRYPVSNTDDVDDIYGYVNVKGVLPTLADSSEQALEQVMRQVRSLLKVKSTDSLRVALTTMLQNKQHLLAVLDKKGDCVGIITMEDIASELVGADIELFK